MRLLIILLIVNSTYGFGQTFEGLENYSPSGDYENISVHKITEDSLQSCFIIWVKHGVKAHYHADHTENIVVISGEGMMTLGEEIFLIKKGDYINIPKGTVHSVTQVLSEEPLKVLSIQSPQFLGNDRIFVDSDK